MLKLIYPLLVILSLAACVSQKNSSKSSKDNDFKAFKFPEDWLGEYAGRLDIYNVKGLAQSLDMELKIMKTDSSHRYKWVIVYAGQPRDYEQIVQDTALGKFLMDEKNGIFIHDFLVANTFYSRFDVQGTDLLCKYELAKKGVINFEIVTSRVAKLSTSGNIPKDSIPPVDDFKIGVVQKAVLYKKK
jgi:hypothetical protein